MRLIGAFVEFARRVLSAAKKGGLARRDLLKLDNLLSRTGRRNTILAKGILSALSAGGASDDDIRRFGSMLGRANQRIMDDKEPFTSKERDEITQIFRRAYVSQKTARWFSSQMDELVAEEIKEYISGKRRVDIGGVPRKKTVSFDVETQAKTTGKKRRTA
ncbi:MAG: hypothetical protein ABII71_05495 [Candidatus Micrarchaeota archaeon]